MILLVRHGHAGNKADWRGDDWQRPLSSRGRAEAEALTAMLLPFEPGRIITSPAWRCRQTVEPLANRLHLEIEEKELLYPDGADAAYVVGYLTQGNVTVVACTHGEVIAALQEQVGSGPTMNFGPDRPREKGSAWVLDGVDGRITVAEYLAPRRQPRPSGPHPRTPSST